MTRLISFVAMLAFLAVPAPAQQTQQAATKRPITHAGDAVPWYQGIEYYLQQFFDHFLKGAPEPDWMQEGVPFLEKDKPRITLDEN